MITQRQLNAVLEEINKSYRVLFEKMIELEHKVDDYEKRSKTSTSGRKRVQQTKADTESSD